MVAHTPRFSGKRFTGDMRFQRLRSARAVGDRSPQWPGATPHGFRSHLCRESHHNVFPGGEGIHAKTFQKRDSLSYSRKPSGHRMISVSPKPPNAHNEPPGNARSALHGRLHYVIRALEIRLIWQLVNSTEISARYDVSVYCSPVIEPYSKAPK